MLEMRGITKAFGAFRALDGVDFTLEAGQVHAMLGENGAGKSTLIKVMTGALSADSGSLVLDGERVSPKSPAEGQRLGISCVYQEVDLLPNLSVAENVMLGRMPTRWGSIDWRRSAQLAEEALHPLGVHIDVRLPLQSYSVAIQQLVAIARAVAVQAKVLVLDEPTSSLDEAEVEQLFGIIRDLRGRGLGIVFITHFLDQVDAIADQITILRNGKLVGSHAAGELERVQLVAKMIGRELGSQVVVGSQGTSGGEDVVSVRSLGRGRFGPITFNVRAGEIVGLAGLLGSGRTETARMLFGLDRPSSGEVFFKGSAVRFSSPSAAIRNGLAFTPEERKTEAIFPSLSVRENMALASQAKRGWFRKMPVKEQRSLAEDYRSRLGIATESVEKPIGQLSGGNQQKAVLGRWLATNPQLLLLDEPTRGIDVGARAEIESLIGKLARDGMAILMISSEIDELQRCAGRLVVMRDGKTIGEAPAVPGDDSVMHLIAGGDKV
ncbi:MAG TPA: sugar ABC transporter ATP-binding protein [Fimbriimonas sp.]|nr:sugar ABC transporter ATP-binding protein [Fimbriimonas sp.]